MTNESGSLACGRKKREKYGVRMREWKARKVKSVKPGNVSRGDAKEAE